MAHVRYVYPFRRIVVRKHQYTNIPENKLTEAYSDFFFSYMYPYNLIVRGQSQSLTSSFINTYYAF